MEPGEGDACWQAERRAVSSLQVWFLLALGRLEMTGEIVTVEFAGQRQHRDHGGKIHRRDDVERYRVFACMHSSTGWQTQEHKKQPSLFANDMVRAKHREEM